MISFSRRQLANYAVEQLLAKQSPAKLARHLAAALIASRKQKDVELLLLDIDQELEDRGLVAKAQVTASHELSANLHKELSSAIKKATGVKEVVLSEAIDKDVLGGLKIETANHTWDKTLRRMLMNIKETV